MIDELGIAFADKFTNFINVLAAKFTNFCNWLAQDDRYIGICIGILILIFELWFLSSLDKKWHKHLDSYWKNREEKKK